MLCNFVKGICSGCGYVLKLDVPPETVQRVCEQGKPIMAMPSLFTQAKNLGKALYKHAADGFKRTSKEEYADRIETCNGCEFHQSSRCVQCGCFIAEKAKMRSEDCPIGKWKKLD